MPNMDPDIHGAIFGRGTQLRLISQPPLDITPETQRGRPRTGEKGEPKRELPTMDMPYLPRQEAE